MPKSSGSEGKIGHLWQFYQYTGYKHFSFGRNSDGIDGWLVPDVSQRYTGKESHFFFSSLSCISAIKVQRKLSTYPVTRRLNFNPCKQNDWYCLVSVERTKLWVLHWTVWRVTFTWTNLFCYCSEVSKLQFDSCTCFKFMQTKLPTFCRCAVIA